MQYRIGVDARTLSNKRPGGIGIYLREVLKRISTYSSDIEYILYSNLPIQLNELGLNENTCRQSTISGNGATLRFRYQLGKQADRDGISVFWGAAQQLPKLSQNIKSVITAHDIALLINHKWGNSVKEQFLHNTISVKSLMEADEIISVSDSTKQDLMRLLHVDGDKISVVHLGGLANIRRDSLAMETQCKLTSITDQSRYFIYIGDLNPRKNVDTIVKAFDEFCKEDSSTVLVLAGGNSKKKYAKLMKQMDPRNRGRVICPGYVDEHLKLSLMKAAVAVLFPSRYEGFGIPVIEAMSCGAVVITSTASSLPEVAGDAAIYLRDVDDSLELAALMHAAAGMSPEQRKDYAEKSVKRAMLFSWEACAEKTLDILKRNL